MKALTPIRVAKWLATFKDDEIVGTTHDACRCPLANCVMDLNDSTYASVGGRWYTVNVGYGQYENKPLEPWQRRFVRWIDLMNGSIIHTPVPAKHAKHMLIDAVRNKVTQERVRQILGC